jgi:hypothetical protein
VTAKNVGLEERVWIACKFFCKVLVLVDRETSVVSSGMCAWVYRAS